MSSWNFVLSWAWKKFYNLGPDYKNIGWEQYMYKSFWKLL